MSTIGPYQHCRHWPRRLWQIHHHWPLDLQGELIDLVVVEDIFLWWQNSAYYMISLIKLCFLIKYNVGRRLILENWFQIIHSDFSVEELTRGPSRCSRRKLRSLARYLFIFIQTHLLSSWRVLRNWPFVMSCIQCSPDKYYESTNLCYLQDWTKSSLMLTVL